MRRELALHFVATLTLLILIILFKQWFSLAYWPVLIGGILGTILPDVDHFIYVYFLAPQELTSQRVNSLVEKRDIGRSLELLYETRSERKNLIFHSFYFQLIFWVLTFLIVSSSGSVFGRGLVGAFSLHLIVDGFLDLQAINSLDNWFGSINLSLPRDRANLYLIGNTVILLIFAVLL